MTLRSGWWCWMVCQVSSVEGAPKQSTLICIPTRYVSRICGQSVYLSGVGCKKHKGWLREKCTGRELADGGAKKRFHFVFFFLFLLPFSVPFIIFALLFLSFSYVRTYEVLIVNSRNSDPGSCHPHHGSCLSFSSRENFSYFFPRHLAWNLCLPTLFIGELSAVDRSYILRSTRYMRMSFTLHWYEKVRIMLSNTWYVYDIHSLYYLSGGTY